MKSGFHSSWGLGGEGTAGSLSESSWFHSGNLEVECQGE